VGISFGHQLQMTRRSQIGRPEKISDFKEIGRKMAGEPGFEPGL